MYICKYNKHTCSFNQPNDKLTITFINNLNQAKTEMYMQHIKLRSSKPPNEGKLTLAEKLTQTTSKVNSKRTQSNSIKLQ